jgi:hypothetical protein
MVATLAVPPLLDLPCSNDSRQIGGCPEIPVCVVWLQQSLHFGQARSTLASPQLSWEDNIRGRPGFDVVGSPVEQRAEVAGRPRKTTGNQARAKNDLALAA